MLSTILIIKSMSMFEAFGQTPGPGTYKPSLAMKMSSPPVYSMRLKPMDPPVSIAPGPGAYKTSSCFPRTAEESKKKGVSFPKEKKADVILLKANLKTPAPNEYTQKSAFEDQTGKTMQRGVSFPKQSKADVLIDHEKKKSPAPGSYTL